MLKKCEVCKNNLDIEDFHLNGSGGRQAYCKNCHLKMITKFSELRECVECESTYKAKIETQKYCSKRCKNKSKNKRKYKSENKKIKICIYCKNKFKGHSNKKYCSDKCGKSNRYQRQKKQRRSTPEYKVCPDCGLKKLSSKFYKNNASKDGLVYRCKICLKKRHKEKYEPTGVKLYEKKCDICREKYEGILNQKYCSDKCHYEASKIRQRDVLHEITCEGCGEKAMVNVKNAKHCSPDCYFEKSMLWPSKDFTKKIIRQRVGNLQNVPDSFVKAYRAKLQLQREIKHKNNE